MKIGVALSGCGIGGIAAYSVLQELQAQGVSVGMISACGIPATTAMLYACGCGETECREQTDQFLEYFQEADMDLAVAEFSAEAVRHQKKERTKAPLVVSGANVSDGTICAFAKGCSIPSKSLRCYPLKDPYDALSAAISPAGGLADYDYDGMRLCDFSVWYGIPVYPLRIHGIDKVVSVSFFNHAPSTPYEALIRQKISHSARLADIHITVEADEGCRNRDDYINRGVDAVRNALEAIYSKTLF